VNSSCPRRTSYTTDQLITRDYYRVSSCIIQTINIEASPQEVWEKLIKKSTSFQMCLQKYVLHRRECDCVLSSAILNILIEIRHLHVIILSSELVM
jgi:hypothetical protein